MACVKKLWTARSVGRKEVGGGGVQTMSAKNETRQAANENLQSANAIGTIKERDVSRVGDQVIEFPAQDRRCVLGGFLGAEEGGRGQPTCTHTGFITHTHTLSWS